MTQPYGPPPPQWGPQPYPPYPPPPPPKRNRAPLFIVLAVLVVIAAVAVVVVVAISSSSSGDDKKTSRAAGPTLHTVVPTKTLRTACTKALAGDMAALVPDHQPFKNAGIERLSTFEIFSCSATQSLKHDHRLFQGLSVEVSVYKPGAGLDAPGKRCLADLVNRRKALAAHTRIVKVPSVGSGTVAGVQHISQGVGATVVGCRNGTEISASYNVAALHGPKPAATPVIRATDRFVRRAFRDLGA